MAKNAGYASQKHGMDDMTKFLKQQKCWLSLRRIAC